VKTPNGKGRQTG